MANKTVVLAIFKDEGSADAAAAALKDWGVAKGDAMGVLVLDQRGGRPVAAGRALSACTGRGSRGFCGAGGRWRLRQPPGEPG